MGALKKRPTEFTDNTERKLWGKKTVARPARSPECGW